jgi:nucleotidyltransferase/DNA polymerase involved in DNA repair
MTAAGRDALTRLDSLMSLTLAERAETYPRPVQDTFTNPGQVRYQSFWPLPDKPRRPSPIWCGSASHWGVAQWVLHVDLDQFIAAVEVLRNPELRGLPIVVGGDGDPTKRGVVSTASYEARAYGVHSGLPLRTAARRCPQAVFLPVDRTAYEAASDDVMAALRDQAELPAVVVEVMGWDEAFLAVDTDDPESFARLIQHQVRAATQLDCTVGIGQNKLQAKIATGFGKPAGVFRITSETWLETLGDKPTDALWGVGSRTAKRLAGLSIMTVADLASASPRALAPHFGPTIGPWLVQLARGIDLSKVTAEPYVPRSRSREVTFQQNLADWDQVRVEVARIAAAVSDDVAAEGRPAVRIVVKVRYAPFFTKTHGHALAEPTSDPAAIETAALAALDGFTRQDPVRLLGVRAEFAESHQLPEPR